MRGVGVNLQLAVWHTRGCGCPSRALVTASRPRPVWIGSTGSWSLIRLAREIRNSRWDKSLGLRRCDCGLPQLLSN